MKRELEIRDYKTVWTMAHKVLKVMSDLDSKYRLAGLVEIDESFWGQVLQEKEVVVLKKNKCLS